MDNFGNELEQCVNDNRLYFNVYGLMICMQVKEYNYHDKFFDIKFVTVIH